MKKLLAALAILMLASGCATQADKRESANDFYKAQNDHVEVMAKVAAARKPIFEMEAIDGQELRLSGLKALRVYAPDSSSTASAAFKVAPVQPDLLDRVLAFGTSTMPFVSQMVMALMNRDVQINGSNNATLLGINSNDTTMGIVNGLGSKIQAPAANVTTTLSGTGVLGSGSYSTDTHANSYNPAPITTTTDNSNQNNPPTTHGTCTTGTC